MKRNLSSGALGCEVLVLFGLLTALSPELRAADLGPKTVKAFGRCVLAAEARMKQDESHPGGFLYIERLPPSRYREIISRLRGGEIWVDHLETCGASGSEIEVPGGMVHHWVGDIFIPGRTISSALEVLRDYDNYTTIYKPEIIRSRLLSEHDDNFEVYLRMQKKSIVTVTLDTWYDVHFTQRDATHGYSLSRATRIQQVEDAGTPQEHLDPVGHDSGYLWRIDSYWRYEQRKDGVIIEWEPISLSRPIPFLLAWFVGPLVRRIARATVQDMLSATRKAVIAEKVGQRQPSPSR